MASPKRTDGIKRFFGIDPDQVFDDSVYDDGTYTEEEPSVKEALFELFPTLPGTLNYFKTLFPFLGWIFHYNLTWLLGDVIAGESRWNAPKLASASAPELTTAGVTVGFVVVPQGMAYALLAKLPAEYGLYTSFVGFILYWAFATSKDITIGVGASLCASPSPHANPTEGRRRHVNHCRKHRHQGTSDAPRSRC